MNDVPNTVAAGTQAQVLRRLFLMLFLRGRSARGLNRKGAPKSVASKLATVMVMYGLFGLMSFTFLRQPVFALSLYLHSMTLAFLGMFVASSAGEVLFNKQESDILMHRPVSSRALLWAKIRVLVEVSLWIAGAFNLAGLLTGLSSPDGGWLFPLAHVMSTVTEALFCTGCIVLAYQLCLRWFGRERLDTFMTTAQVAIAIVVVLGSQMAPQLLGQIGTRIALVVHAWWIVFIPSAWFAGLDQVVCGYGDRTTWTLGLFGIAVTAAVLWLAFGKLARQYERGLQAVQEAAPVRTRRARKYWAEKIANAPPLSWFLRDPVSRASFLLTCAYLARDRDVKLRVYPALAPFVAMPVVFLVQGHWNKQGAGFGVAFACAYIGIVPLLALRVLRYSQQWQATDLFRCAPVRGPAPLCHGARVAVLAFLVAPVLVLFASEIWLMTGQPAHLALLLPGIIALPVYSILPCVRGDSVPLSHPTEEAKAASRGLIVFVAIFVSLILGGIATTAWKGGWFWWFISLEAILAVVLYVILRIEMNNARWQPIE